MFHQWSLSLTLPKYAFMKLPLMLLVYERIY